MKCADVYSLLFEPGEVTEIRAYGLSGKGKNKAWEGFARGSGVGYGYLDKVIPSQQVQHQLEEQQVKPLQQVLEQREQE